MYFKHLIIFIIFITILSLPACGCSDKDIFMSERNFQMISRADNEDIMFYSDGSWHRKFWYGVNLGATTPGHHPGELSPSYDDYRRWFSQMEELGIDLLRIYTILPPSFYKALADHNQQSTRKLWFVQGIWPLEEDLINQKNAYLPSITNEFHKEISYAVGAVFGQVKIPPRKGKASGDYTANTAPYLLAWMLGSEWDPYTVALTDADNPDKGYFHGNYFRTSDNASPFEAWLARCLEVLAKEETKMGWQHPVSFVNWVTTDPIPHPDEPFARENMASIDPLHIAPTEKWEAGYFAFYHVYPYYPDSLRFQENYLEYVNSQGKKDPYEAYVRELKSYHSQIPLVIAEFGVPSSRGMAHSAPLNRNQGMHTELEQGEMAVDMFQAIERAGASGAVIFEWHDEWFKFTWNTWDLEIPAERRPMWLNRLTNEENFGLIAVEPGYWTTVFLDGDLSDWDKIKAPAKITENTNTLVKATHDEAYLYIAIEKPVKWNWEKDRLYIGFDNQPGGNSFVQDTGIQFQQEAEFLLSIDAPNNARLTVASAYDQHTYCYGKLLGMVPWKNEWEEEGNGIFLPWKLCLSRELFLPASKRQVPFEEIEVGNLIFGISDPESPEYNSLADYYLKDNILELRIPWMMLGFTDPSTHQVWAYPYRENLGYFTSATSPGITMEFVFYDKYGTIVDTASLTYDWENWNTPTYHERKKQSFFYLKSFLENQ